MADYGIDFNMQTVFSYSRILICLFAAAAGVSQARAEIVRFEMTGMIDVTFQVGELPPGIYQDAPFTATLSYELDTPDVRMDDPNRGLYITTGNPNNYILFRAGSSEIQSGDLTLWVGNDVGAIEQLFERRDDTFLMRDSQFSANFDFPLGKIGFAWNDPTRTALENDSLPSAINLWAYSDTSIFVDTFSINPRTPQFSIAAHVESITVVPEPSTCLQAMSAGLAAIMCFRQRCLHRHAGRLAFAVLSVVLWHASWDVHEARAGIVRFELSGTIDVSDPFNVLPDGIDSGMPFMGTFAYDLDAVDQLPNDPQRGLYVFSPQPGDLGFFVQIGEHEFKTDATNESGIHIYNDVYLGVSETGEPQPPLGDMIFGQILGDFPIAVEFPRFGFGWSDLSLSSFGSDALPTILDASRLASVDSNSPILTIGGFQIGTVTTGPRWFQIQAIIESITPIPEPPGAMLAITALLALPLGRLFTAMTRSTTRSLTCSENTIPSRIVTERCVYTAL